MAHGDQSRRAGQMAPSDHNGVLAKLRPEALSRFCGLAGPANAAPSDPRRSRGTELSTRRTLPIRAARMVSLVKINVAREYK